LREDYAEGVRLKELEAHRNTNTMGFQLQYSALAALSCGVGHSAEARLYIQAVLQRSNLHAHTAIMTWITPCLSYTLAATEPAKAVTLLAWVFTYPHASLNWARQWPLLTRLRVQLQAILPREVYQTQWEQGSTLTLEDIASYLSHELQAASDTKTEDTQHDILTTREREILRLMAVGKTNRQIADHLIIGAGTVKTHTLNIYRKLEVANRTQAIVRAQELGLLPT
jgi:ATP/maltotriose-dependent transcriptional regulator MalT